MNLNNEEEKRKFVRIANNFFLRFCKAGLSDEEDAKVAGIVHDLSEGGLSFLTEQDFREGDLLDLELEIAGFRSAPGDSQGLLNSAVVITQGTVLRAKPYELGPTLVALRFNHLESSDRALILQALSKVE